MSRRVQCQVGGSHNIVSDAGSHPSGQRRLVVPRPWELRPCELHPLFCVTGPPRGGLFVRLHLCFRLGYALINIAPKLYDSWRHFFGSFDPRPPPLEVRLRLELWDVAARLWLAAHKGSSAGSVEEMWVKESLKLKTKPLNSTLTSSSSNGVTSRSQFTQNLCRVSFNNFFNQTCMYHKPIHICWTSLKNMSHIDHKQVFVWGGVLISQLWR